MLKKVVGVVTQDQLARTIPEVGANELIQNLTRDIRELLGNLDQHLWAQKRQSLDDGLRSISQFNFSRVVNNRDVLNRFVDTMLELHGVGFSGSFDLFTYSLLKSVQDCLVNIYMCKQNAAGNEGNAGNQWRFPALRQKIRQGLQQQLPLDGKRRTQFCFPRKCKAPAGI